MLAARFLQRACGLAATPAGTHPEYLSFDRARIAAARHCRVQETAKLPDGTLRRDEFAALRDPRISADDKSTVSL